LAQSGSRSGCECAVLPTGRITSIRNMERRSPASNLCREREERMKKKFLRVGIVMAAFMFTVGLNVDEAHAGGVWGGAKAFTVTSGPGFSLMMEHIGYAAMTETPCVFVDVQRGGPS